MKIHTFSKYPQFRVKETNDSFHIEEEKCGLFGGPRWFSVEELPHGMPSFDDAVKWIKSNMPTEIEYIHHEV